ncbi:hypothetical protein C3E98_037255 [Pseudomonas sp. MWU13-2625]|nr:hypothetical protein C3E98_037255 [Pseudomonas sp. MWU13-2625]
MRGTGKNGAGEVAGVRGRPGKQGRKCSGGSGIGHWREIGSGNSTGGHCAPIGPADRVFLHGHQGSGHRSISASGQQWLAKQAIQWQSLAHYGQLLPAIAAGAAAHA